MTSWEKAIFGALGEFRGILAAAHGIQKVMLGMRNSILGMAFHDLSNMKPVILGATPGAIPGIDGSPHERFSFAPTFSKRLFKNWSPRARESNIRVVKKVFWANGYFARVTPAIFVSLVDFQV